MFKAAFLLAAIAIIAGIAGYSNSGSVDFGRVDLGLLRLLFCSAAAAVIACAFIGYVRRRSLS